MGVYTKRPDETLLKKANTFSVPTGSGVGEMEF